MYGMKVCSRRNWLEPNFYIKEYQTRPTFCGTQTEERTQYSIQTAQNSISAFGTRYSVFS